MAMGDSRGTMQPQSSGSSLMMDKNFSKSTVPSVPEQHQQQTYTLGQQ